MFGCCLLAGQKFRDKDGNLDQEAYEKARLSLRKIDSRGRLKEETPIPKECSPCDCECHNEGKIVLC